MSSRQGKFMKITFRFVLGIMLCGSLIQLAQATGPERGQPGELPVVVGTGSLTVAGQGYWYRKVYDGGESPSLSAYDNNGALLPDGVYRYEFRSFPDEASESPRQQNLVRVEGKGITRSQGKAKGANVVSGRFEVLGGELIYN